jgi:sigma-B regulation protein RsbU (phosphoserine phosphatase)
MITECGVVDVSQDWVVACGLQERFMETPCATTQSLTYNARCRQMRALGGDCFHFVPLPGRRHKRTGRLVPVVRAGKYVALAVADASGKGLPAALIIANVQSSLRTATLFAPEDPGAVVTAVNRQLHACSPADRYATLFYGVFDEHTRRLHYVNAGHNPAVVIRRGSAVTWLEASAPPVGLFAETVYRAQAVQLYSGDLVVAYTDGIVEATNTSGADWGVEGLLATVKRFRPRQPGNIVEAVFAALDEFAGDKQTDDATMLAALVH